MANKKFTDLNATTSLVGTDLIAVTVDPATTPVSKKSTISTLMAQAPVQSVAGQTGVVTLSNTDISGLGTAATSASTDFATATQGATADSAVQPTDSIDVLADVDTSTVSPTTNDFLNWDGSNWVPAVPTADVNTPLTTALRGTDNPHIGAYPNQSFKVTDNPSKSVMVIADANGNLDFVVKSDSANIYLNTPSSRKAASFGFSVVEDSVEPDIEVAGTLAGATENYSVISGDSDSKGANGLPLRQGFNNPDIGANPAPILISGGSIA
jgi:hypothetical protein